MIDFSPAAFRAGSPAALAVRGRAPVQTFAAEMRQRSVRGEPASRPAGVAAEPAERLRREESEKKLSSEPRDQEQERVAHEAAEPNELGAVESSALLTLALEDRANERAVPADAQGQARQAAQAGEAGQAVAATFATPSAQAPSGELAQEAAGLFATAAGAAGSAPAEGESEQTETTVENPFSQRSAAASLGAGGPGASETSGSSAALVDARPAEGSLLRDLSPSAPGTPNTEAPESSPEAPEAEGHQRLNAARIARGLGQMALQRGGGLTLRLSPEALGTVRIELHLQGTSVQARLQAETAGAQQMLSQHLGSLKQALETQGLVVERLTVQPLPAAVPTDPAGMEGEQGDGRSRGRFEDSADQQAPRDRTPRRSRGAAPPSFAQRLAVWAADSVSHTATRNSA